MKYFFNKTFAFFAAALMLFSFSTNVFAANRDFNLGSRYARTQTYYHTLNFTKWGTDTVTIVNTGGTPLFINAGAGKKQLPDKTYKSTYTIKSGEEVTFAYKNNGKHTIYMYNTKKNTVSYRIKTTSGTISNVTIR